MTRRFVECADTLQQDYCELAYLFVLSVQYLYLYDVPDLYLHYVITLQPHAESQRYHIMIIKSMK